MHCVLVTDIFGENRWTDTLTRSWQANLAGQVNYSVVSPYREHLTFKDETYAYRAFCSQGGLKTLTNILAAHLTELTGPVVVLGFSAGAAAAWQVAARQLEVDLVHTLGFYPGQIRHHLDLVPDSDVSLFFPKEESHFDLDPVVQVLSATESCRVFRGAHGHGYINPNSEHYDEKASQAVLNALMPIDQLCMASRDFIEGLASALNYREIL